VQFSDRALAAQSALIAVSTCALVVAALFAERRTREELLAGSNERLRAQEQAFRRLLGSLPAAIYTTDKAGCLTYCNQAAVELWGRRPELGKDRWSDLWRLHYPDGSSVPLDERPTQIVLNEGRAVRGREALLERPDGTLVPIMPCPAPLLDEGGTVIGVVNMQIDLTERKRTEAQLAEREAQLSLFVEHAPAAIAMFDREMRYLAVSRRFVVDYRLPPDAQLVGRSHYDVFPEVPQRWRDIHARVLAGEEFSHEEDRFTRKDGHTDWIRWSMAPWRRGDGRIGGAVLFTEVKTEQVEAQRALTDSEARFRATFENAAVGVALVGSDGSILRANDSFARMLGYSAEELRTRTFQDITYPDDLTKNLSALNRTLAGEAESYSIEKRYVRKDGRIVWANLTVGCVRRADNDVDYFISVIQDITARKLAEARLAERNAQLDLAYKAARVGSYAYDFVARTMRVSSASAAIYGLSPSTVEMTAEQWHARIHRDDMQRVRAEHIAALKQRRRELVSEFRYVRPGGEVRWIEARSLVAYDDACRARRMTGVYIDVTERKQAEAELRDSESRLADALAAGQVIAFEWDAATRRSRRSTNAAQILGCADGGLQCDDFFRHVHPDDRRIFKACMHALCPDRPAYAMSFRFRCPGGRQLWLEETAKGEFNAAGRLLRIKGLTRDITDRKKAERALQERNVQLSLAGRAALVGSFAVDFETEEVQVSEGYAALHGLPEGTSRTTRSIWKAGLHPEDQPRVDELRGRVFREQRGEYGVEYRIIRPTGEVRWIEARCFVSYGSDARPERVVGVDIDVTERKRAEEHQRMLVAELDHRVKNVLATVSAVASRTQDTSRSGEDFVATLAGRIQSMAATHELLSCRQWKGVSLSELVQRVLAPYMTRNNTDLDGPELTLSPEAAQAVSMVLHELTTNAAKHGALSTDEGRVSVRWGRALNGKPEPRVRIQWRESAGPAVQPPQRSGYGMEVIRNLIPYELGGAVELVFAPGGVRCDLDIPATGLLGPQRPCRAAHSTANTLASSEIS
jgi:PAS domain S-box-containing protein